MAITVTNTNAINLLNIVNQTTARQQNILTQLSTGSRINRGRDDPAGIIALGSLNSELNRVDTAITNNQRTNALLGVADGAINEISSLLSEVETLVAASTSAGNLTDSEVAANQAQIDAAIESIDRIVRTTNFNGNRLLDGSFGIDTTGLDKTKIDSLKVFSRGSKASATDVTVIRTTSAQTASAVLAQGISTTGTTLSAATTIQITGTLGSTQLSLASGLTGAQVITAINAVKDVTGVSAIGTTTSSIQLNTTGYGSDEFVSVDVLSGGGFSIAGTGDDITATSKTTGVDAVVSINGQAVTADGLDLSFNQNGLSLSFSLTTAFGSGTTASTTEAFTVQTTGGGKFQLGTDASTVSVIGIDALSSFNLGGGNSGGFLADLTSGGTADLRTNTEAALRVIRKSIQDVSQAQGRIGSFQKFQVQTSINSLNASKTGLSDVKSVIGDTDFATATAELNRQTVLLNTGISLLGVANQQTSQILSLLG
jgi:flagellin